jgi:hypothetical protein
LSKLFPQTAVTDSEKTREEEEKRQKEQEGCEIFSFFEFNLTYQLFRGEKGARQTMEENETWILYVRHFWCRFWWIFTI